MSYGIKDNSVCHVYVGNLPVGAEFIHKDKAYKKISTDHVVDMKGTETVMESHYGAIITKIQFDNYELDDEAIYE